jgi:hypothetical protein
VGESKPWSIARSDEEDLARLIRLPAGRCSAILLANGHWRTTLNSVGDVFDVSFMREAEEVRLMVNKEFKIERLDISGTRLSGNIVKRK